MKLGLIITGGRLNLAFAGQFLEKISVDCVISVDGGLEKTRALGLKPDAVVGDFDTVDPSVLEEYKGQQGILWDVQKPEKDETDTELAINTAIKLGCTHLAILGATGGRLDHELSNLHLLKYCLDHQVEACLWDPWNKVYLLRQGAVFQRKTLYGPYVSFLPLTEQVRGITLTGFKYPLKGKNISIGTETGLCVSNELSEDLAAVTFDSGILICIESREEGENWTGRFD